MEIVMPIYLRSSDAIEAFGDGDRNVVIEQRARGSDELLGKVVLTYEQFQLLVSFESDLLKEASYGPLCQDKE